MQTNNGIAALRQYWQEVKAGIRPRPERGPVTATRRKVRLISTWARSGQLVVTLHSHGELAFREPGRRATYRIGLAEAYRQAVLLTTAKIRQRAKELRKAGASRGSAQRQARRELLS